MPIVVVAQFPFDTDTIEFDVISTDPFGEGYRTLNSDHLGRVWISNRNGLFAHNGHSFIRLNVNIENQEFDVSPIGVRSFLGPDNQMWFVLHHTGVLILDMMTGEQNFISPASIHGHDHFDHVWNVKDLGKGDSLVIHTDRGFALIDSKTLGLSPFHVPFENDQEWEDFAKRPCNYPGAVRDLIAFPNTTDEYLLLSYIPYKYHAGTGQVEYFGITENEISSQYHIDPSNVFQYGDDIWITGREIGFRQVDIQSGKISDHLYQMDDMPNPNSIRDLIQLNDSIYLFAGTYHAGAFNVKTKTFELFRLPERDSTLPWPYSVEIALDGGGHLWWSSRYHFYRSKQPIIAQDQKPNFYLDVKDVDRVRNNQFKSYTENEIIDVSRKGQFSFSYYLINPGQENKIEYAHWLSGYDQGWIASEPTNKNRYSQLDPGQYELELRAVDQSRGIDRLERFPVHVEMFWYDQWYSKIGLSLLAVGLIGFIIRARGQKIRIEERLKMEYDNKLTQLEMNALRAQMNPHFVFNSMNSIKSYLVKKGPDEAADYLTRFGHLIRVILENSKHDMLTLEQELSAIELYVEMEIRRFKEPFEFELDIDPDIDLIYAQIPPMLIQPYVENAIWHGLMPKKGRRKLKLQIVKLTKGMLCIIEDNGIGRNGNHEVDPLQAKASLGNQITSERIETMNKIHNCEISVDIEDLKHQDGSAAGTRVKLHVIGLRI